MNLRQAAGTTPDSTLSISRGSTDALPLSAPVFVLPVPPSYVGDIGEDLAHGASLSDETYFEDEYEMEEAKDSSPLEPGGDLEDGGVGRVHEIHVSAI